MNCYLHVGISKTGSTAIQRFLSLNRSRLAARRVLYPATLGRGSHTMLVAYGQGEGRKDDVRRAAVEKYGADIANFREALARDLLSEVAENPAATSLLISSEHMHSRLNNRIEIATAKRLLDRICNGYRVVIYLRRQDKVAISRASTQLKVGAFSLDNILPKKRGTGETPALPRYYSYGDIVGDYVEVFGRDQVTVRLYAKDETRGWDIIDDFCDVIDLPEAAAWPRPAAINRSLGAPARAFLALFNTPTAQHPNGRPAWQRQAVVRVLESRWSGTGPTPARVDIEEFVARFAAQNERVREAFFPGRASLFSTDFSEYPESTAQRPLAFEDAACIALDLWDAIITSSPEQPPARLDRQPGG